MKGVFYTILAKATRGIQTLARVSAPTIRYIGKLLGRFLNASTRKFVFVGLKTTRYLKRYWHGYSAPLKDKIWIVVTSPWTLRGVVFLAIAAILVPQTTVWARGREPLAQESLLYELVGPGEEYFVEEGVIEGGFLRGDTQTWRAGAVRKDVIEPGAESVPIEPTDITSIAVGGTAITKPTIIPGAELGERRTRPVNYVVREGDTVGDIAQNFGVTVATILWENDLSFRSYIRPGDSLTILPVSGATHV